MDEIDSFPTATLRFVKHDGRYVLQQQWEVTVQRPGGRFITQYEWRDVPVEGVLTIKSEGETDDRH